MIRNNAQVVMIAMLQERIEAMSKVSGSILNVDVTYIEGRDPYPIITVDGIPIEGILSCMWSADGGSGSPLLMLSILPASFKITQTAIYSSLTDKPDDYPVPPVTGTDSQEEMPHGQGHYDSPSTYATPTKTYLSSSPSTTMVGMDGDSPIYDGSSGTVTDG